MCFSIFKWRGLISSAERRHSATHVFLKIRRALPWPHGPSIPVLPDLYAARAPFVFPSAFQRGPGQVFGGENNKRAKVANGANGPELTPGRKVKFVHASTQVTLPDTYIVEKAAGGKNFVMDISR